jgi:hypothetical protein
MQFPQQICSCEPRKRRAYNSHLGLDFLPVSAWNADRVFIHEPNIAEWEALYKFLPRILGLDFSGVGTRSFNQLGRRSRNRFRE